MTQEEKQILFKDLCARLPYRVKIHAKYIDADTYTETEKDGELSMVDGDGVIAFTCDDMNCYNYVAINEVKPYLFPFSSMTEEQLNELKEFSGLKYSTSLLELVAWTDECTTLEFWLEETPSYVVIKVFKWLNKNHFDYRDLITQGLAIEVKAGNNPYK